MVITKTGGPSAVLLHISELFVNDPIDTARSESETGEPGKRGKGVVCGSGPVGLLGELVGHEDSRGRLTAGGGDLLVLAGIAHGVTACEDTGTVG